MSESVSYIQMLLLSMMDKRNVSYHSLSFFYPKFDCIDIIIHEVSIPHTVRDQQLWTAASGLTGVRSFTTRVFSMHASRPSSDDTHRSSTAASWH